MQWVELSCMVGPAEAEQTVAILNVYGKGGAALEEREEETTGKMIITIKIYLPRSRSYKNVRCEIEMALAQLPFRLELKQRLLKPADWFDSLKQHFGVLEIGERFIIKPSWICRIIPPSNRMIIELDPGAAFGTGLHSTTRLCLIRLEKHLCPGMSVLDLGTGSGILAIAAAKLGATPVVALDIDPLAVKSAASNAKVNAVDRDVQVRRGESEP
jgi:ribosomal protein L11 methyltransferase